MLEGIMFLGLSGAAWFTLALVITVFLLMVFTKLPADIVFLGCIAALYLCGVLSEKEAMASFSSSSVITVGVLFVVVAGLVHTGVLHFISTHLLGTPRSYPAAIVRLMLPVAGLSAFLANSTVVAMFIHIVGEWAKKLKIAPSRLLIPLSYASGFGGVCTLIGTPPNLIVSGLYQQSSGNTMNVFVTLPIGLVCLAVGILSVLAMQRLLPVRKSPLDSLKAVHEFTVELLVPTDNPHVGQTLQEAGLYEVKGGHIVEIVRFDKETISPVSQDEYIFGGDRLVYAGEVTQILELKKQALLVNASEHVYRFSDVDTKRHLMVGYIPLNSPLVGHEMSDTHFERDEGLSLVAIAREGERVHESPRYVKLSAGDTLLLEGSKASANRSASLSRVLMIDTDSDLLPQSSGKTVLSSLIMIAMIALSAFKVMSLLQACFLAALAMVFTRCCSVERVRQSIDWSLLMLFSGSVCLGTAIEKTHLATAAANGIFSICGNNPYIVLIALYLVTTFVTELVSNTATAAIFYPIAYSAAVKLGVDPMPFLLALMVAASSSFATPIGSPTHMMVYGPGGYRFTDFMRIGLPMNFIIAAAAIIYISIVYTL